MNYQNNKKLYYEMLRIRMVEEYIAQTYSEKNMRCPIHLSIGQEATAVGVCSALNVEDKVLSAHRSHAHYLAKGGSLNAMIAELHGKTTGCAMGKGGSMHLIDLEAGLFAAVPIVGSTIPIGVGVAWGIMQQGKSNIIVIFFGDGATEEGVFHESIDFACLKNLPVLFVCENNFYSVYSPLEVRQSPIRSIKKIVNAHGLKCVHGGGNDVINVLNTTNKAVKEIKNSNRPYFLIFDTFRWLEHCGPNWDNDVGYRKKNELKNWLRKCPIKKIESKLINDGDLNHTEIKKIRDGITDEIKKSFNFAKKSKFPKEHLLWEHVYAE